MTHTPTMPGYRPGTGPRAALCPHSTPQYLAGARSRRQSSRRTLWCAPVLAGLCLCLATGDGAWAQSPRRAKSPRRAVSLRRAVSPRRAFWSSLLIPGWGQIQTGQRPSGARFLAVEAALWSGFLGWQHVVGIRRDTYRTFAADRSGATTAGKGSGFFDDLGYYESRLQHNQFARVHEGADAHLYPDTPEFFWEWDDEAPRLRFRSLRNSAETAERNALYATGLVVANHLISAIHAARGARAAGEQGASSGQNAGAAEDQGSGSASKEGGVQSGAAGRTGSGTSGEARGTPARRWPVTLEVAAWPGRIDAALVHRF